MTTDMVRFLSSKSVLSSFITYYRVYNKNKAMGTRCGTGTDYPSEVHPRFSVMFVLFNLLIVCVVLC